MEISLTWNERMAFTAASGDLRAELDARPPFGQGRALSPKKLVLAGLCGCTAMDVVGLLRKHRQTLDRFEVRADATSSEGGHPKVFTAVRLEFHLEGELDVSVVLESVRLSQTKYCGVSAMLSRVLSISYEVWVNGASVGTGQSDFETPAT
jgi:putative redox protein